MKRKCFVAIPIGNKQDKPEFYEFWKSIYDFIKPIVENHFECIRADEISERGNITKDIIEQLDESYLVIADMTGQNPNVFYELGVRHTFTNRTILLAQNFKDIPFDLNVWRTIIYDFKSDSGKDDLKNELAKFLQNVIDNPEKIDNPVQDYLFSKNGKDSTPIEVKSSEPKDYQRVNYEQDEGLYAEKIRIFSEDHLTQFFMNAGNISAEQVFKLIKQYKTIVKLMKHFGYNEKEGGGFRHPDKIGDIGFPDKDYQAYRYKHLK